MLRTFTAPVTTSSVAYNADGSAKIVFSVAIPGNLSNKQINDAVTMIASRAKHLLGQRYRQQIHRRVSVRSARPSPPVAEEAVTTGDTREFRCQLARPAGGSGTSTGAVIARSFPGIGIGPGNGGSATRTGGCPMRRAASIPVAGY
jgi:hypothetical protein